MEIAIKLRVMFGYIGIVAIGYILQVTRTTFKKLNTKDKRNIIIFLFVMFIVSLIFVNTKQKGV